MAGPLICILLERGTFRLLLLYVINGYESRRCRDDGDRPVDKRISPDDKRISPVGKRTSSYEPEWSGGRGRSPSEITSI